MRIRMPGRLALSLVTVVVVTACTEQPPLPDPPAIPGLPTWRQHPWRPPSRLPIDALLASSDAFAGTGTEFESTVVPAAAGPTPWYETPELQLSPADAALRSDLLQDLETNDQIPFTFDAFPLTGDRFNGRTLWVATHRWFSSPDWADVLGVYERRGDGWVAVARYDIVQNHSRAAVVDIEPSSAWIAILGANGSWAAPGLELLRFDGESLHRELVENSLGFDFMFVDVDRDGIVELLAGYSSHVYCNRCGLTAREAGLFRWDGTRMTRAFLETLPAGAASEAAVAANNRAVQLARARRWAEAVAVLDRARPLVAESVVFRRNAALIDLTAVDPDGAGLSSDRLLHYIFAGLWTEAVDLLRDAPVRADLFTDPPGNMDTTAGTGMYRTPPFLKAIFDATAAARTVAPARSEVEFLYGWSSHHLQGWSDWLDHGAAGDSAAEARDWHPTWYRFSIDADESAALEALDRAVALAPDDPLFAEARRLVAGETDAVTEVER